MDVFKHCLEKLKPEDIETLNEYFRGYDYRGASYTFLANYIWKDSYSMCWERIDEYLLMAGQVGEPGEVEETEAILAMPLTRTGTYDVQKLRKVVLETKRRFDEMGVVFRMVNIPGHMVHLLKEAFPDEFDFVHERDYDEYVYEKDKLMYLSGRALHKKKNHLNYFYRTYHYEVKELTADMEPQIMDLVNRVREVRSYTQEEEDSLTAEKKAIRRILAHLEEENVYSVGIFIHGQLEAFAIGERLNEDTAVEHFEKANDSIRGLYQAICSEYCQILPEEIVYVNREEDMGLENLRQAKEALRPHHMEERYLGYLKKDEKKIEELEQENN